METGHALRALPGTLLGKQHRLVDEPLSCGHRALHEPGTFRPFPMIRLLRRILLVSAALIVLALTTLAVLAYAYQDEVKAKLA